MDNELDFLDIISFMSFLIGYSNLIENRQQSADNDVSKANEKQANYMLKILLERFDEQDKILKEILKELRHDS